VTVSNVTFTGAKGAAGKFFGGAASINIATGVVLSSGSAKGVVGPNNTGSFSTSNGTASDAQLDTILGATGFDAAVLEFDFVPLGGVLHFQYVFGSEEYPEFVNAGFNDVFAFFLNGQNVALIPNTSTPVSIDNVNATTNSQFYVDNTSASHFTQMDAFTTVLPVTASVNAGQVNHIKLAIEDGGDDQYDSWVCIKTGSFGAPLAPPAPNATAYRPVRYVQIDSTHVAGTFTLVNYGNAVLQGPLYVYLPHLPYGVTATNYTAHHHGLGYFALAPTVSLVPFKPIYKYIVFYNPYHVQLSTFLLSFPVAITQKIL
jgi:hypothetical protein